MEANLWNDGQDGPYIAASMDDAAYAGSNAYLRQNRVVEIGDSTQPTGLAMQFVQGPVTTAKSVFDFSAGLPGEKAFVALMTYLTARRQTMDPALLKEEDRIGQAMLRGWHNFWVSIGWPGEKV